MTQRRIHAVLLVGLLAPAFACGGNEVDASTSDTRVPVRVESVERRDLVHRSTLTGRLRANAVVEIQPKAAGRIVAFHKWEGDSVQAGDLLVELDTTELKLELRRAQAAVAQALARRDEVRRKLVRAEELHDRNVLSKANLETARAEAQIAEADLRNALASRDLARQRVEDALIRAPIDGVLQDRAHSVGDYAVPSLGGSGMPGSRDGGRGPIFTLIQTDPLLLEVNVSEQDAPDARDTNEDFAVNVDAFPGEEFTGTVDYVAPSLDPVAFTQLIRLRVPNRGGQLKPGMFARIEVNRYVADGGLVISADALVDLGDKLGVYVVDEQHVAHLVSVQTHFISGNEVALAAGLEEGDQVITEGKSSVREGTEVRLIFGELQTGS